MSGPPYRGDMNLDDFRAFCDTLALDELAPGDESLRYGRTAKSEPPLAFRSAPESTQSELKLGETIGEGGMGVVRAAEQSALRRGVAVKTIREGRESTQAQRELLHEALITGGLEHPNIVPIYSLDETDRGSPLIVMKRIEGVSWRQCIAHPQLAPGLGEGEDLLDWHLDIFEEVCLAAHFAHSRGILHRDIKPDNVMIGAFGEVYLLDWGVAVTTDHAKSDFLLHVDETTGVCGTPAYMAPEMASGESDDLGPATDVYLLGATLYHVLTGRPPHEGANVYEVLLASFESKRPQFPAHVPDGLVEICCTAMERSPGDRYSSADELRRAVHRFRGHRSSITLADEAAARLAELRHLVRSEDDPDEVRVRNLFGECQFGFEQAARVWQENPEAIRGRVDTILEMARFEIRSKNLRAAEALASQLDDPSVLDAELRALRRELARRDAELEELRELERESNLATGASARARAAAFAWIFLTIMPLVGGAVTEQTTDLEPFFLHGVFVWGVLTVLLIAFRKGLWANQANRKMAQLIFAFGFSLPLLRYLAWQIGLTIPEALCIEAATYSVVYAALGFLSNFFPWFGLLIYAAAAVFGFHAQEWVFEITAAANFLAIGYITFAWNRQRSSRE